MPLKGKILTNKLSDAKDNKNGYVLFEKPEMAAIAKERVN